MTAEFFLVLFIAAVLGIPPLLILWIVVVLGVSSALDKCGRGKSHKKG